MKISEIPASDFILIYDKKRLKDSRFLVSNP